MAITISGSGITSANIADGAIVDADVSGIAASKLTGALPAIDGSALTGNVGKVLQVGFATYSTNFTTASSAWVNTGLTITLTPKTNTSKMLVDWNQQVYAATSTSVWEGYRFRLLRNGVAVWTENYGIAHAYFSGNTMVKLADSWLDSPATTASVVYVVQVLPYSSAAFSFNHGSSYSQMKVMEIAQ
jgi:hypothetical protein